MTSSEDIYKVQDSAQHMGLIFCSLVLFLHGIGFGAGLGYAGLVLPHHVANNTTLVHLSTEESTWFVGVTALAMTTGVLISIPFSEKIGRKKLFLVSNTISILGYVLMYFAQSFLVLVAGRTVQCIGMGLGAMTIGVFLSEVSTVKMRGPIIGISQTSNCIGLLISTSLCIFLPIELFSIVLALHSFMVIILMFFIPGSPQWLLMNNKEDIARQSLKFLRGNKYPGVEMEITEIKNCIKERQSVKKGSALKAFGRRTFTLPLLVFTVVFTILGACGNDTFVFYGPTIFAKINIGIPASVMTTLPWIGYTIGYLISSPLMAKMKRRHQFLIFASIMSASMFGFGAALKYINKVENASIFLQICLVASLQVGTIAYGAGVGSVSYTMVGEVFIPEYKTIGACVVQSVRGITVFILVKAIPTLISCIGLHGLFFFHGCVLVFAVIFAAVVLPETKGKTLTELCSMYKTNSQSTKNRVKN